MRRGEIWRVRLPAASGHAQAGDRPAIIVQTDATTAVLPTVLIVPFTSSSGAARFVGTLRILPDKTNGLTLPSVAMAFQLRAIDKRDCVQPLGTLDAATMAKVLDLIYNLVG